MRSGASHRLRKPAEVCPPPVNEEMQKCRSAHDPKPELRSLKPVPVPLSHTLSRLYVWVCSLHLQVAVLVS